MLLTRHARTMHLLRAHSLCPLPVPAPCAHHSLWSDGCCSPSPTDLTISRSHDRTISLPHYLTISLPHYLTISLSHYLVQVGWLLLSLTDPMGPPGPVLEAVLSAGGEVSGQ